MTVDTQALSPTTSNHNLVNEQTPRHQWGRIQAPKFIPSFDAKAQKARRRMFTTKSPAAY